MENILTFFQQNETTVVISMISVIIVLMTVIIIIDKVSKKKDNIYASFGESLDNDILDKENSPKMESYGNIKQDLELPVLKSVNHTAPVTTIKYVEENEELEKTNARLELQALKENLIEKEKNNELEVKEVINNLQPVESIITSQPEIKESEEVLNSFNDTNMVITIPLEENKSIEQVELKENVEKVKDIIDKYEDEQEENAIISVDEVNNLSEEVLDAYANNYKDEEDSPISIKELEVLFNTRELNEMELEKINQGKTIITEEEMQKEREKLPDFKDDGSFKTTPFISPVFGLTEEQDNILLEQTANYEKLNDEIKRTNEFLVALKELKKNLE